MSRIRNAREVWEDNDLLTLDFGNDSIKVEATQVAVAGPVMPVKTQTAETATATITVAEVLTGIIDGTPTAAATYTLPTAAEMVAAMKNPIAGMSMFLLVNNVTAATHEITMAGGTGFTDDGTLTVAVGESKLFMIVLSNVTVGSEAALLYGIGT